MAKNWLLSEVAVEFKNGNKEAIMDVGKRFPLLADLVSRAVSGDADAVVEILRATPERLTAGIMHTKLKENVGEYEEADSDEVKEEKPAKPAKEAEKKTEKKEAKKSEAADDDYESKGAYPLYLLCKERGIEVKSKQPKEVYVEALRKADAADSDNDGDDGWDEGEEKDYESMSAKELYSLCKERGLKVEPKKQPKEYIKALKAADAESEDGDDGWDDEDEKPAKEDKKAAKKSDKKAAKKEEEDDEEWDI